MELVEGHCLSISDCSSDCLEYVKVASISVAR